MLVYYAAKHKIKTTEVNCISLCLDDILKRQGMTSDKAIKHILRRKG